MVSIVCVAFNHERFIARALEGFLQQQVGFRFEVIVHDDASTDGTAEVVRTYAAKHPDVVVPVLQTENQYSKGNKPWSICFPMARGKYIALCEGDDHWVDPLKLQQQVEALEADPGASGCFTNAYNEGGGVRKPFLGSYTKAIDGPVLREQDYISGQGIPTCTFVFVRALIGGYPELLRQFATGDTALFTLLLGQGHFIYLPIFTGVRVMHEGGVYSMRGTLDNLRTQLKNLPAQDRLTQGRYGHLIRKRRLSWLKRSWQEAMHHRNWELGREAWSHLRKERAEMGWSLPRTWVNGLLVHYPNLVFRMVAMKQGLRRVWGGAPRT